MSTGSNRQRGNVIPWVCAAVVCLGTAGLASTGSDNTQSHPVKNQGQKKSKKQPAPLPPLPSGPTGPVQPIPLDSIAAVPPQVSYENNQLTIVAPNSTLGDILRAVRKLTGAEIEIPSAPERVVTNLGPGPAREVVAELLNGSRFNYVLLGSPADDATLTRVVLVAKTSGPEVTPGPQPEGGVPQATANNMPPQQPPPPAEAEAEANNEDNNDDSADQAPEGAEQQQQPNQPQDQNGVKTPQQMLQEMQQRQLQMQQQQQQQQNGQPPLPGPGRPPGPPQQQDQ
jgi:hypothetical protein